MSYISRTKHFSTLYMYIYKSDSSGRLGIGSGWKTEPSMSGIRKKRSNSERISQPTPIRLTWNWRNSSKRSEGNSNRKAQASLAVHLRRSRIRFRGSVQLSVSALIKEFCAEVNESRERFDSGRTSMSYDSESPRASIKTASSLQPVWPALQQDVWVSMQCTHLWRDGNGNLPFQVQIVGSSFDETSMKGIRQYHSRTSFF